MTPEDRMHDRMQWARERERLMALLRQFSARIAALEEELLEVRAELAGARLKE
jgi:hypothetical protein